MKQLSVFLSGVLFAVGLVVAQMTRPSKIVGFLDFFGDWDPSLLLVMAAAVFSHFPAYLLIKRRSAPVLAPAYSVPTRRTVDVRLVVGALLFGAGWGLAGYCPGPALSSLVHPSSATAVFVAAMLAGMALFRWFDRILSARSLRQRATTRGVALTGG